MSATWKHAAGGGVWEHNEDELPIVMVTEPDENDILSGRGGLTNTHPGNVWYRSLVRSNRLLYRSERKHGKIQVAKAIVMHVMEQKPPSRFLEQSKEHQGKWVSISRKRAIDKTSQALRERIHQEDEPAQSPSTTDAANGWHQNNFSNTLAKTIGAVNGVEDTPTLVLTPPPDYGNMVVKKTGAQNNFSILLDPGKQSDNRRAAAMLLEAQRQHTEAQRQHSMTMQNVANRAMHNQAPRHNLMNNYRQENTPAASDPVAATLLNLKRKIVSTEETAQHQQHQPPIQLLSREAHLATTCFKEPSIPTKKPELESMVERISSRFVQNTAKRPKTAPTIVPKPLAVSQAAQYCRDAALNYNNAAKSSYRPLPNRRAATSKINCRALPKATPVVVPLPPAPSLTQSAHVTIAVNRKDVSLAEVLAASALTGFVQGKSDANFKTVAAPAAANTTADDQFADSQDDQFADPEEEEEFSIVPISAPAPTIVPVPMAVPAPIVIAVSSQTPSRTNNAVDAAPFEEEVGVVKEENNSLPAPEEVVQTAATENAEIEAPAGRQTYPPNSRNINAGGLCRVCKSVRFDRVSVPKVPYIETHPELAWPIAKGKSRRAIATVLEHCTEAHLHWPLWNTLSNTSSTDVKQDTDMTGGSTDSFPQPGKQVRAIHVFYRALAMACCAAPHKLGDTYTSCDEMRVRIAQRLGLAEGYVKWGRWETTNRKALEVLACSMIRDYGSTLMLAVKDHWFGIEAMDHQERLDLFNNVFLIPYCVDTLRERGELFPKLKPSPKRLPETPKSPDSGESRLVE